MRQRSGIMGLHLLDEMAFLSPTPLSLHRDSTSFPRTEALCNRPTAKLNLSASKKPPDAGLIGQRGDTGTLLSNLWPVPILGEYSWFLNVYDRELAASTGPFTVYANGNSLRLEFSLGQKPQNGDSGDSYRAFPGVAMGNINVNSSLKEMGRTDGYELRMFEKGNSENFLKRRNEVHVATEEDIDLSDAWRDPAPTYKILSRASAYEVRELYAGCGSKPRSTSPFEYFAMSLSAIPPFKKYSCFVCVWKQKPMTAPTALDKLDHQLRLSFFEPLEIPADQDDKELPVIGLFAVRIFYGAVTDGIAKIQHERLLQALASSPSTTPVSEKNYRLVVNNKPDTIATNRRNEIWVELEM